MYFAFPSLLRLLALLDKIHWDNSTRLICHCPTLGAKYVSNNYKEKLRLSSYYVYLPD